MDKLMILLPELTKKHLSVFTENACKLKEFRNCSVKFIEPRKWQPHYFQYPTDAEAGSTLVI